MSASHGPVEDYFKQLLGIDNPSTEEAAIRAFIQATLLKLDTLKLIDVLTIDDMGNLFVRLKGDPNKAAMMFCAHMDSVPPCRSIQYIRSVDEKQQPILQAAGTTILGADDRAGIATMLAVFDRLQHAGTTYLPRPVEFLFTVQEEIGIKGAKALDLDQCLSQQIFVLDGEGNLGDIFNQGPARQAVEIHIHGKAAHSAMPEKGMNAIWLAGQIMTKLPVSGRISPDSSFNLGRIRGGDAVNIIAHDASLEAELRSFNEKELNALGDQIYAACDHAKNLAPEAEIVCSIQHQYDSFCIPESSTSVQQAITACKTIAVEPKVTRMYIGSDAHILNARGREAIVLGMGFHGSHSVREFIRLKELAGVVEWVWALIHQG